MVIKCTSYAAEPRETLTRSSRSLSLRVLSVWGQGSGFGRRCFVVPVWGGELEGTAPERKRLVRQAALELARWDTSTRRDR